MSSSSPFVARTARTTARAPRRARAAALAAATALAAVAAQLAPAAVAHAQPATGGPRRPGEGQDIAIAVGEEVSIPSTDFESYTPPSGGFVDVRPSPARDRLILTGVRVGTTAMNLTRADGSVSRVTIHVVRMAVESVRRQLSQLLAPFPGLTVNQVGGMLFIEGPVAGEEQQRRIQQIAALFPGQVESLATVEGTVAGQRMNIRIDLYFVELSRTSGFLFGVRWPAFFGGGTANINPEITFASPTGGMLGLTRGTVTGIIEQPLPRLDLASNAGWARVHRHATLVTANGSEATYFSGGELNFRVTTNFGTGDIRRIEFGSTLAILPRFDAATSRIDLRVSADLSDVSDAEPGAIPARSISRVNTQVNMQLGQSIVLSGMRSRSSGAANSGLPGLAQIPILGALFGSQARRDRENEMVIFVVPTVIDAISRQAEDRVAAALRAYEEYGSLATGGTRGHPDDAPLVPGAQYNTVPAAGSGGGGGAGGYPAGGGGAAGRRRP